MARRAPDSRTSLLEWISAAIGLVLLALMFGVTAYDAVFGGGAAPASIGVETRTIAPSGPRFLVAFDAVNTGGTTAAAVEIEGVLTRPGHPPETAHATLDYVAADARTAGGLFFDGDPRAGTLELRALGFQEP